MLHLHLHALIASLFPPSGNVVHQPTLVQRVVKLLKDLVDIVVLFFTTIFDPSAADSLKKRGLCAFVGLMGNTHTCNGHTTSHHAQIHPAVGVQVGQAAQAGGEGASLE